MATAILPPHRHGVGAPLCDVSVAGREADASSGAPHVVIVGGGFGGLSAAKGLAKEAVRVTLIDRRNHHLFQPLLYQVATAGLSPAQIAAPIRTIFRRQQNVTVLLGEVTGVDLVKREVRLGTAPTSPNIIYDYLVIATGARHSYFGHDDWEPYAPGLKSLEDATKIRRHILLAFERAEAECDPAEQSKLLTFVIIGAGPTGVEMAGAIAEIARHALAMDFRNIDPRATRVVLVEAGPRILPAFPEQLSNDAHKRLEALGVEVRLGRPVTACDGDGAVIGAARVDARTIIWAAGVMASPAAAWLGAPADRAGRVVVGPDLSVPGQDRVFVIGDTADAKDMDGKPLPGLAPVAKQEGLYVAHVIAAQVHGRKPPPPFAYRSFGNLATIGRQAAVVEMGQLRLTGFVAWLLWSVAHIFFLIGFRNRLTVAIDWLWAYITFERGARLITNSGAAEEPLDAAANAGGGAVAKRRSER
ncbi:MAG: NAD(P)/FAD-dependent oxidoreductase [Xanthobacteraceae bacterium]